MPHATIAVFSRPVGYRPLGPAYGGLARIQPLSHEKQGALLAKWLGRKLAQEVHGQIESNAGLREACRVPLILSLLAYMVRSEARGEGAGHAPRNRRELFQRSLTTLLERGHSEGRKSGVKNPAYAREILGRLSLKLQTGQAEAWERDDLDNALADLEETDRLVARRLKVWNGDAATFLDDVSERSGVLAEHDGPEAPWRFLHRQLRELLAAEALRAGGDAAVLSHAERLSTRDVPRWAEVMGFACELAVEPLKIVRALGEVNEELVLRVLPELEGVDCVKALETLRQNEAWDGDFLTQLIDRWVRQGGLEREQVVQWLWLQVKPERSIENLAYLHFALEHLGVEVDFERFGRACNRWQQRQAPAPYLVHIAGGTFLMGSPSWESAGDDSVRETARTRANPKRTVADVAQYSGTKREPTQEVRVQTFFISAHPVTNGEYALFDPGHPRELYGGSISDVDAARLPVVNVTYWEAYLYARWSGCVLPTEAQWEYACRARTSTSRYGSLPMIAWYCDNSDQHAHPPGLKRSNNFNLHDMLGNVWEWCREWQSISDGPAAGPSGSSGGARRPVRGAAWYNRQWDVRAAIRASRAPGERDNGQGFRLARESRRKAKG